MFIVTKEIDSENISKLCRTCLREDGEKMICLFVGPAGSSLAAKLQSLSCLEVWQGDGLPEKLCDRCVTRAESALLFREQCRAADRALRQAAARVSGHTSGARVTGCKLYQQNDGFTSLPSSQKPVKCSECGAVFMDYQEFYSHSRSHASLLQTNTSLSHVNAVESHYPYVNRNPIMNGFGLDTNANRSLQYSRKPGDMSDMNQRNDKSACTLHCSMYNHVLSGQNQLVNNTFPHCGSNIDISCDSSVAIGGDSSDSVQNFSYQRTDLSYNREEHHFERIPPISFPENSTLNLQEQDVDDLSKKNSINSSVEDEILRFPRFPQHTQTDDGLQSSQNLVNNNVHEINITNCEESETLVNKKHKCKQCGKSFAQKSKLMSHELSHTGERPFKCHKCDKSYISRSKLNAHTRLHTLTNVHQCNICKKNFSYPSYLIEHLKTHRKKSTKSDVNLKLSKFECSTCSKKFKLKKNLRAHMKFHSGKNLFHCEICHKPFSQKFNLKVHARIHKNARIYKCEYCDKSFNEKGNYMEHFRIHTKVKPFICQLCGKAFSQSSHLKTHEATHSTQRPHECRLCGKRFKLSSHLQRHMNIHSAVKAFKCDQCNQMFSQAFSLKRHLKRHSENNQ